MKIRMYSLISEEGEKGQKSNQNPQNPNNQKDNNKNTKKDKDQQNPGKGQPDRPKKGGKQGGKHVNDADKIMNGDQEQPSASDKKVAVDKDSATKKQKEPKGVLDPSEDPAGNPETPLRLTSILEETPTYSNPLPKLDIEVGRYLVEAAILFKPIDQIDKSYMTISRKHFFPFISALIAASKSGLPIPLLLNGQKFIVQGNSASKTILVLLDGATMLSLSEEDVSSFVSRFLPKSH